MRDKPTVRADGYHTCYALAGLSHAVNRYWYEEEQEEEEGTGRLMAAFRWRGERAGDGELREWGVEEEDCVECVHPVFVIPFARVEEARVMFAEAGFRDDGQQGIEEGVGKLAV
ncbi:Protein farnesyltransferase subunit beta [Teratosphaeria destructans]|uniref:Protein farnesyltransferase subunit beta n=1 Tax=Teratosphaeria destructans TaxID=418781 RepID=A0A9W7W5K4_9PEZI|nr:Protein farnesyltransferase subunit beta [Teratosphaeria destructans]